MKKKVISSLLAVTLVASLTGFSGLANKVSAEETVSEGAGENVEEAAGYDLATAELPDEIKIAFCNGSNTAAIAQEEGVFQELEDAGVKVSYLFFDSGRDINTAFASGSVDIGYYGSSPIALGLATEIGYEVATILDLTGSAEGLAVRPDSGIETIEDLVGKKVAVTFSSTSHYSLLNALAHYGISAGDVTLIDMGASDIYAAWERGDIDAAFVWTPALTELLEADGTLIIDSGDVGELGYPVSDILVVRQEFGQQYHDAASAVVNGFLKVNDVKLNETDRAVQDLVTNLAIDEEAAQRELDGNIVLTAEEQQSEDYVGTPGNVGALASSIQSTAQFHLDQGNLTSLQEASYFEEIINPTYLADAVAHGE